MTFFSNNDLILVLIFYSILIEIRLTGVKFIF